MSSGSGWRHALRRLRRAPGFTVAVILILALAIGATTVMFTVVDALLLRPLPFRDAERLVLLQAQTPLGPNLHVTAAELMALRERLEGFEGVAGFAVETMDLWREGETTRVTVARVSPNFFQVLGLPPVLGPGEVVVSHGFFGRHLGGDEAAVGRTAVVLNDARYTVVGVLPAGAALPEDAAVWLRGSDLAAEAVVRPEQSRWRVVGRPQGSSAQTQAALQSLHGALEEERPALYRERGFTTVPLRQGLVGDATSQVLLLLGLAAAVLLIACTNVSGLQLARGADREGEVAIRKALGATRGRLLWGSLLESALLALAGGGLGVLGAYLGLDALLALSPRPLPRVEVVAVDGRVLLAALVVSLGAALLSGVLPAWQGGALDAGRYLNQRQGGDGRTRRWRSALVMAEVAASLVLLAGAGLLFGSLLHLRAVPPGFTPQGVLQATVEIPTRHYPEASQRALLAERLLEAGTRLPGVENAALGAGLPFSGWGINVLFQPEGFEAGEGEAPRAALSSVSPGYFSLLRIPLLQGRALREEDRRRDEPVAVISQRLARSYFPAGDALGRRVVLGREPSPGNPWMRVVGVVGDVHRLGLDREVEPTLYRLHQESRRVNLLLRAGDDPAALIEPLRHRLRELEPRLTVKAAPLVAGIDRTLGERRSLLVLLGSFAGVALLLSAVGLYGLAAYGVRQRRREIGIRRALGAERATVVRMMVRQGLAPVLGGIPLGILCAAVLTQGLDRYLFGLRHTDLRVFTLVVGMVLAVTTVASYLPARRAARIAPTEVLRRD